MSWAVLGLPLAVLIGWLIGRQGGARQTGQRVSRLSSAYFRGLNYLLNEQQDKAIELFLEIAEVDPDTVETQIALGHLFRRRGEVDRAIRLHQGLVARQGLSEDYKTQAILELGEDYMRAGLLDRAETLFGDLVRAGASAPQALRHLIEIYQAERDWPQAIVHARRLQEIGGQPTGRLIAHFHCELAAQARGQGDVQTLRANLEQARLADPGSVRVALLDAELALEAGEDRAAIAAFERTIELDPDYLSEALPGLIDCHRRLQGEPGVKRLLDRVLARHPEVPAIVAMTESLRRTQGHAAAIAFVSEQLIERPSLRGQAALIRIGLDQGLEDPKLALTALQRVTERMLEHGQAYRCERCGFGAKALHWQCPSCKSWGSVKSVQSQGRVDIPRAGRDGAASPQRKEE